MWRKHEPVTPWSTLFSSSICFGIGAATMFFLDPVRGNTRRKLLRGKCIGWSNDLKRALSYTAVDTGNRAAGLVAETRRHFTADHANDITIEERVRSAMGRAVTHARPIHVSVSNGVLTLSGPVPVAEVDGLLRTVAHVRGVKRIINQLSIQEEAALSQ